MVIGIGNKPQAASSKIFFQQEAVEIKSESNPSPRVNTFCGRVNVLCQAKMTGVTLNQPEVTQNHFKRRKLLVNRKALKAISVENVSCGLPSNLLSLNLWNET